MADNLNKAMVVLGAFIIIAGVFGSFTETLGSEQYKYQVHMDQVTVSEGTDYTEYSSLSEADKKIIDEGIRHGDSNILVNSKSDISGGWTLIEVDGVFYLVNVEHIHTMPGYTAPAILVLAGSFLLGVSWASQRRSQRRKSLSEL